MICNHCLDGNYGGPFKQCSFKLERPITITSIKELPLNPSYGYMIDRSSRRLLT